MSLDKNHQKRDFPKQTIDKLKNVKQYPKGVKKPFPKKIEPMLSTLIREPFNDPDWLYEVKFDGFRIMAYKQTEKVVLKSRKLDFTKDFQLLAKVLQEIQHEFVIDGEAVVVNEKGVADFDALQK